DSGPTVSWLNLVATCVRMRDALAVIDVINHFEYEDGDKLLASFLSRIEAMSAAIDRTRQAGIPVIYVNDQDRRWDSDSGRLIRAAEAGKGAEVARTGPERRGQLPA